MITRRRSGRSALLVAAFIYTAFNFRTALVAVSPMVSAIRRATGLSAAGAGTLVTVPLICFGLLAPIAPVLARRRVPEDLMGWCIVGLAVGIVVRGLPGLGLLFVGTVMIGSFVAVINVMMPALVKAHFPNHVGLVTGLNLLMLNGGAAIAAGATVPAAAFFGVGWRIAISWWALTAAAAAALWFSQRPRMEPDPAADGSSVAISWEARPYKSILGSSVAWSLTIYMGVQSFGFYSILVWLPTILHHSGYSLTDSGLLLSVTSLASIVSSLTASVLAGRRQDQRTVLLSVTALTAAGIAGLLFSIHHFMVLWALLIGSGQGAAFAVFLVMMVFRSHDPAQAITVAGMSQGLGYLFAAIGPTLMGGLFDLTHSWTIPIAMVLSMALPQAIFGYQAARDRLIALPSSS